MEKKTSKLAALWNMKCPRCHTGDLFKTPTFSFRQPFEMHTECPHCKLDFYPEPGYYYGAMFISYIWTGWFCVIFIAIFHWLLDFSLNVSFLFLIAGIALFFVWIFRISRAMWIHLVKKFDKNYL